MTSEDGWAQIAEAQDKDQWASQLELCVLHLKKNSDHIQAQIPQAIALRHLNRFDEAVALLQKTYTDPNASEKCKYQCQTRLCKKWEGLMMRGEHMKRTNSFRKVMSP